MSERTRYIIIGMQRSGTTVTHVSLYGHPNVCAMIDEFRVAPFFTAGVASFTVGGTNPWEREHGYKQLFDAVTIYYGSPPYAPEPYSGSDQNPKPEILANGMKIAVPRAADAKALAASLVEFFPEMKIIYVHRDDWLAQYASLQRAAKSGKWHSWTKVDADPAKEPGKIEIVAEQFEAYIHQALEMQETFEGLRATHSVCDVRYETDIAQNSLETSYRVFDFVGVPRVDPTWVNSQKVSPPIEDFVSNHADMRELLDRRRGH
jgi:hypothetical protein